MLSGNVESSEKEIHFKILKVIEWFDKNIKYHYFEFNKYLIKEDRRV